MPKEVNVLPNLRIDIPDYKAQTSDFARGLSKQVSERFILDNLSTIAEGFRVEIADQTINPGLFTVYNGNGFDRSGQIISNENDARAARSQTLTADATYFIEVEFTTSESDTDARGFWDPRFSNGADPSGDPLPGGREFSQNVATRITPDWRIVTPIATTAFDFVANPNSIKVPVAVITVAGGLISGGVTSPLRTILVDSVAIAAVSLKLLDTRAMLDAFTLTVNPGGATQENVTVTANDRENGILTLAPGVVNAHSASERVVVGGATPSQFLVERDTGPIPTAGTIDGRPRLFQGDEERGHLLSLDPTGSTAVSKADDEVKSLHRFVDFLAGQIRELKFGAPNAADVGDFAPPSAFTNPPRYYDVSGGLVGSRGHTVSVGDGVSSWGDFNTLQTGTAQGALQAAHDALPATGGTIYVKVGTYSIGATTLTISKPCVIIGDGISTVIESDGVSPPITITGKDITFRDLVVAYDGSTAPELVEITATAARISFLGVGFAEPSGALPAPAIRAASGATDITFDRCLFPLEEGIGEFTDATDLKILNCDVTFFPGTGPLILDGTSTRVQIQNTKFTQVGVQASPVAAINVPAAAILTNSCITNCIFVDCDYAISAATMLDVVIRGCKFTSPTAARGRRGITAVPNVTAWSGVIIDSCSFSSFDGLNETIYGALVIDDAGLVTNLTFTNNRAEFISTSALGPEAYGIYLSIVGDTSEGLVIANNEFRLITASATAAGIRLETGKFSRVAITGNLFHTIANTGASTNWAGIWLDESGDDINVTGNIFKQLGHVASGGADSAAVRMGKLSMSATQRNMVINSNVISEIANSTQVFGISVESSMEGLVINGNKLESSDSDFIGISVRSFDANAATVSDIAISGNIVSGATGNIDTGIQVILLEAIAPLEGRVSITGNVVRDTNDIGIGVVGAGFAVDSLTNNIVIASNSIESDSTVNQGIQLKDLDRFAVTGNSVYHTSLTGVTEVGIVIINCNMGVISGNIVNTAGVAAACRGIDTSAVGTEFVLVASNFAQVGSLAGGTGLGIAIDLGEEQFCAANFAQVLLTGGAGSAIGPFPMTTKTEALIDGDSVVLTDGSIGSMGLNRRFG